MVFWVTTRRGPLIVGTSAWEAFGHIESVKVLVILNPATYMLTYITLFRFIRVLCGTNNIPWNVVNLT
jgi:hypothetical protein